MGIRAILFEIDEAIGIQCHHACHQKTLTLIRPTGLAGQTLRPSHRRTDVALWLTVASLVEVSRGCRSRRASAPPCWAGRPTAVWARGASPVEHPVRWAP